MKTLPFSQSYIVNCRPAQQYGVALITSLLILTMLTLLALSMFRGFGLQQKIAGNVSEKERAYEAAQNVLQYAEWWLAYNQSDLNSGAPSPISCTSAITVGSPADMRICDTALSNPSDPTTWAGVSNVTPAAMQVLSGGGSYVDGNGNTNIKYARTPGLYINWLTQTADPTNHNINTNYYSITAVGYGGSPNSLAVVHSIYKIANSKIIDIGCNSGSCG